MLPFHLTGSIFPAAVIAFTLRDYELKKIAARRYERKGVSGFTFCNGAYTEDLTSEVWSVQDTLWAARNECWLSAPSSYYVLMWWPVQSSNSFIELFPQKTWRTDREARYPLQGSGSQHWDTEDKLFFKSTILGQLYPPLPLFSMLSGMF